MFRLAFLAFLAVAAAGVSPASAQPRHAPRGDVMPLDRFLPQVRRHYPGTFYDADGPFMDEAGSPHYSLKWMTPEGRVIWLDTDARTGRVLGVQHGGMRGGYRNAPPPDERAPPQFYPGARGGYFGPGGPPPGAPWGGPPERGGWGNRGGWGGGRGGWGGHGGHGHHGG